MKNELQEYLENFKTEEIELIVRITWCEKNGVTSLGKVNEYIKGSARFDLALNLQTGEIIGQDVVFNWIEWLYTKKFFYLNKYKFIEGGVYRILVREYISKKDDKFKKYYLEKVLEENVNEPRLDPLYNFKSKFSDDEMEMIVLIKNKIFSYLIKSNYRVPSVNFIASINNTTKILNREPGKLIWMEKNSNSDIKFNFDKLGIYLVKVKISKENNNSYLLVDVLQKMKNNSLEEIKEEYLKPVVINDKLGEFKLNRDYNSFEGDINYLGSKCNVYLEVDEGRTDANLQLNKLKDIYTNLENWNNNLNNFIVEKLLDYANDYNEEDKEITKEDFLNKLGKPSITIKNDLSIEVIFDSNDIFNDHFVVVNIDKDGNFINADLEG